jgi:hypothetical protein
LIGNIIWGIAGPIFGALLILVLEKRGIIDKLSLKMIWPPYYFDYKMLRNAIEDADSEFYLITGDGSFFDDNSAIEIVNKLIEKSGNTKIKILFTGDINLPDIRRRIYELYNKSKSLNIHILENISLSQALRATFSVNTKEYCCLRIGRDEKTHEYILKKYEERDLIKLITGYFDLTKKIARVEETDNKIDLFIKEKHHYKKVTT